jgi:DNA modification methylase
MPSKFHPPTRKYCQICEDIKASNPSTPLIDSHGGKASSANKFPIHNWYNFVLGYSPDFPNYIMEKFKITSSHKILDPFMGAATTNVAAKELGIESFGIEANDYFINVGEVKLTWNLNIKKLEKLWNKIYKQIVVELLLIDFEDTTESEINFDIENTKPHLTHYSVKALERPDELLIKYLSHRPFVKLNTIKEVLESVTVRENKKIKNFFKIALSSIIVPSSNISYGPGFGVRKAKLDYDVLGKYKDKVERMIGDLKTYADKKSLNTPFKIIHGDARRTSKYIAENSIDFIITSPPYPGDHEYTKHTKLELIFENHAKSLKEFRVIKKRMLVGSTTNIYKESNDRIHIQGHESISKVTSLIQARLIEDNATSGFEKLYTKLVWEYFGGMTLVFQEALKVLKNGGKFSLLVSDSHAFKMVHIKTAEILLQLALSEGFESGDIELWQNKKTTSHGYNLREEILTVIK